MILIDTSIWIDHLHRPDLRLFAALDRGDVLTHPFVIGELACGQIKPRDELLVLLRRLPTAVAATHDEAMELIETRRLMGKGISFVDVHLLAAVILTGSASLWTRDEPLGRVASHLGLAYDAS